MTTRGWVLFGAMCLIWGVPYLLIKVAVEDVSPSMLVLARTAIAGLLLLPIAALRNELRPLAPHWRALVAFAGIEIALPWVLLGAAETRISSSLTALLIAAVPLIGTGIALGMVPRERLTADRGLGLVLGLAGVASIVGLGIEGASPLAIVQVFLVAVWQRADGDWVPGIVGRYDVGFALPTGHTSIWLRSSLSDLAVIAHLV